MKNLILSTTLSFLTFSAAFACEHCSKFEQSPDFRINSARVVHNKKFGTLEFEITVAGKAGNTRPTPAGQLDMAPVLGYVFPTTLKSEDIGFAATEGIVALAVTVHPDFDDSPFWDENADGNFENDGIVWHPHWVVLVKDDRVKGGLAVKEHKKADQVRKPATAPDMPMFMDSPGFPVVTEGSSITVSVPAFRVNNKVDFNYDAVSCYMQVSAPSGDMNAMDKPMLGVYNVYSVLSKNLSLPYKVK